MKKLLIISILFFMIKTNAQMFQKIDREYTTLSFGIDPYASYKGNGPDVFAEITLVSYFGYVKAGVQAFPTLTDGYVDFTGGIGLNQKSALLGIETRMYQGIRGGFIKRGGDAIPYGLFGIDLGFDIKLTDKSYLGIKGTYNYRDDMRHSGANPCWIKSGFITYTIEL